MSERSPGFQKLWGSPPKRLQGGRQEIRGLDSLHIHASNFPGLRSSSPHARVTTFEALSSPSQRGRRERDEALSCQHRHPSLASLSTQAARGPARAWPEPQLESELKRDPRKSKAWSLHSADVPPLPLGSGSDPPWATLAKYL